MLNSHWGQVLLDLSSHEFLTRVRSDFTRYAPFSKAMLESVQYTSTRFVFQRSGYFISSFSFAWNPTSIKSASYWSFIPPVKTRAFLKRRRTALFIEYTSWCCNHCLILIRPTLYLFSFFTCLHNWRGPLNAPGFSGSNKANLDILGVLGITASFFFF